MNVSISNIAWDSHEDTDVLKILRQYDIRFIDVAPSKYFPNFSEATSLEIESVRAWWRDQGVSVAGMQSLLFGTQGLNVFGSDEVQSSMLTHLEHVCRIGKGLGATYLTFGSPRNRDRSGLTDQETQEKSISFFNRLADIADRYEVVFCLEPNPTTYGSNFMVDTVETANVVKAIGRQSIRMQLDTGAMSINNENPNSTIQNTKDLVGHVHLSEAGLAPFGSSSIDYQTLARALKLYHPTKVWTIEMLATSVEPHLTSIERSIKFTKDLINESN